MQDILHREALPPAGVGPEAAERSPAGRFGRFDRKKAAEQAEK